MKLSFTGTPRMPPFLLMSSAIISAAFLPGTPNTEAGPERKVVIAILSSAGLSWAAAALDSNPANSMPASEAFSALRMTVIEPSPSEWHVFVEAPLHLDHPPRRRSIRASRNLTRASGHVGLPGSLLRTWKPHAVRDLVRAGAREARRCRADWLRRVRHVAHRAVAPHGRAQNPGGGRPGCRACRGLAARGRN